MADSGKRLPPGIAEQASRLLSEGLEIGVVAQRLGVSRSQVRNYRDRRKAEMTPTDLHDLIWPEDKDERRDETQ